VTITPRDALRRVTLSDLETFVAVAELGSFSAAAQHLHVSQPAVTNRVQRLEAAIKTRLLTRTTRRVHMTPAGELLFAQASQALDVLDEVLRDLMDSAAQDSSRLVVASTPFTASILLPPLVRAYRNRRPDRDIVILDLSYSEVLAALEGGDAHMAILTEPADDRFVVEAVGSDDVVLIAPPRHALTGRATVSLDALVDQELILIDQYRPLFDSLVNAMNDAGLSPPTARWVRSMSTVLGLFEAGMGLALMTRITAELRCAADVSLMDIEGLTLQRVYSLVLPRRSDRVELVREFCDHLRTGFMREKAERQA